MKDTVELTKLGKNSSEMHDVLSNYHGEVLLYAVLVAFNAESLPRQRLIDCGQTIAEKIGVRWSNYGECQT